MPLDPWASYAGKQEDLSDNPWASSTSDVPFPAVGSVAQNPPGTSRSSHKPQQHLWGEPGQGSHNEAKAEAGPWADLHALQQDVWGDVQPIGSGIPDWPTHPPTDAGAQLHAAKLSQEPPPDVRDEDARDEDEFGEFEEPDLQTLVPYTKTPAPELKTSTTLHGQKGAAKEIFSTATGITHSHQQMPERHQQYDPWAGLESLEKIHIEEPVAKTEPRMSGDESPAAKIFWDADEWVAFPSDPVGSSAFSDNDKNTTTAKPRTQAVTKSSWIPSKPVTNDKPVSTVTNPTSKASSAPPSSNELPISWDADEWEPFSPDPNERPVLSFKAQNITPLNPHSLPITHPLTPSQPRSTTPTHSKPPTNPPKPTPSKVPALPPTNIPPPSILLSLLTSLITTMSTQVRTISSQPHAPASLSRALHNCLSSLRVAARILAGRRLRWKRSPHLAQSMSIGPSHAGKPGGMKLSSVDKTEVKREEREAAEFIRVWKGNLGSIRAALAQVSGKIEGRPLTLPEIAEGMSVRALKGEGAVGKSSVCFLCGLKREERVGGVDGEILDGWGEWWVEFWGHVECKTFWEEHERFLQRRG